MKRTQKILSNGEIASLGSIGLLGITIFSLMALKIWQLDGAELTGARSYATIADNLLAHGSYSIEGGHPGTFRAPLYVLLVTVSKLIAGANWSYALLLFQSSASLTTGILVNRITVRLSRSNWLAAAVTLTYSCHLAWLTESLTLRESGLFGLLVAWFFYLASSRKVTIRTLTAMTLVCLLAYHTRGTGFVLIGGLIVFIGLQSQMALRERAVVVGIVAAALLVGVAPWQTYQTKVSGQLALAPTSVGGEQLFIGNSKVFDQVPPYADVEAGTKLVRESVLQRDGDPLRDLALAEIAADPLRFFRKVWLKATVYLSPLATPLGSGSVYLADGILRISNYEGNLARAARDWLPFATHVTSFFVVLFIIPLGLLGNVREALFSRTNRAIAVSSLFFLAANIGLHALLTAETRYRLYLDPLLIVWAWMAVMHMFRVDTVAETRPAPVTH